MFDIGAAIHQRRKPTHLGLVILCTVLAVSPVSAQVDFEARLAEAASKGVPALLKIEADWCVDCRAFDKDLKELTEFGRDVESKTYLISIDAEKGRGIRLAESYRVDKYPTFVLTDSDGRTMDRWYGYWSAEEFSKRLDSALKDPLTVGRRSKRFASKPTEADAYKLGEIATMEGYYGEAIAYYRQAGRLGGHDDSYYSQRIMGAMIYGAHKRVFDIEQVITEAEPILANPETEDFNRIRLMSNIARLAQEFKNTEVARDYFRRSVEETKDSEHPKVVKMRARLLPDYALLVEGDPEAAILYLENSLPSDWENDSLSLNNVAWWCFKNQEHLEDEHLAEAERLARRGVELSRAGNARANVLDTLAEICNLRGSCGEALELIREAIGEDPQNEYFQQQAVRFEEILADQERD